MWHTVCSLEPRGQTLKLLSWKGSGKLRKFFLYFKVSRNTLGQNNQKNHGIDHMIILFVFMMAGRITIYREGTQVTKFWKMQRVWLLARPTHEEVVYDDESGCNEDSPPHITARKHLLDLIFGSAPSCLLCRNFNCRAKQAGCPPMPPARMSGFLPHICSHFYWHTHPHWVNKSLFKSLFA